MVCGFLDAHRKGALAKEGDEGGRWFRAVEDGAEANMRK